MGTDTLIGDNVYTHKTEAAGDIKEIMLDVNSGRIAYAVSSFGGSSVLPASCLSYREARLNWIPQTNGSC